MESRHLAVMMTDIQGFTKATSGMGRDAVDALLARHEELLLPVFAEHDGTVVKGLGDAFLVTFESPTKAVRAGIRVQEVLADHNASAEEADVLRVRVAINSGEVNLRGGDVFGEAVNITARVEGVCASEQVTLTEAAYLQVDRDALETEYLEAVELKGIPFPVKLYRVVPHWLAPDARDIERARSKPPPAEEPPPRGGGGVAVALGGIVLGAVVLGGLALGPSPRDRVEAALAGSDPSRTWEVLEETQRRSPFPELASLARGFCEAERARRVAAGEPAQAHALLQRFARSWPGVQGFSDPPALAAAGVETVRVMRAAGDLDAADAFLEELAAGTDLAPFRETLAAWALEDLARLYDAAVAAAAEEAGDPDDGGPLAGRLGEDALVRRLQRVRTFDPEAPLLLYVEGIRTMLAHGSLAGSGYGSPAERAMRGLAKALAADRSLGARVDARPAYRAFLSVFKWQDDVWEWGDQTLARHVGAWFEPVLAAWVNASVPEGAGAAPRTQNLYLRKNATRILTRRGGLPDPERPLWVRLGIDYVRLRPKGVGTSDLLERVEEVAVHMRELGANPDPGTRASFRDFVAWGLQADDETMSWRQHFHGLAREFAFADLVDDDRELYRDLFYLLKTRTGGWNFQVNDWDRKMLKDLLGKIDPVKAPWRARILGLIRDGRRAYEKAAPDLLPLLDGAAARLE